MTGDLPKSFVLENEVFGINNEESFHSIALAVFHFQYANNPVYRQFCSLIHRSPGNVRAINEIPFLPIEVFKSHTVIAKGLTAELIFESSGTTGAQTSRHHVARPELYRKSFLFTFTRFFGPPAGFCVLGLLPSYLERGNSSLVYMVQALIEASTHPLSGFYLHDYTGLAATLQTLERSGQPAVLFGVSYALLDFAAAFPQHLQHTLVVETGGMKGRKKELTRQELHDLLKSGLGLSHIYSEYGMTELLSQAYGADGRLQTPPWMKVLIRDEADPFHITDKAGASGGINVIDLANLYSCSFIATSDAGRLYADGSFEILGRLDSSDVRGCSLLVL
jgi:phenylacetate-coenzyme A ligase PaaK-like adenylate-forming protein